MQQPQWRQLPDGTWLNEVTDTVSAPLVPDGRAPKRAPSPPMGSSGPLIQPDAMNPQLTGLAGNYGALPGQWNLHMRNGRNYPALGQEPANDATPAKRLLATVMIVGIVGASVWWQRRRKAKKSAKE